ncbi:MAG TPA: type II toxin-antitoxin system VapC family toxin [Candidatus Tumulicola sp.]
MLDASAAVAWFFEDELDDLARAMALTVARSGALVPALFRLEVQNALLQAVRKKRLTRAIVEARFDDLDQLNLTLDAAEASATFKRGFALAERFRLSAYDAAYLELAVRAKRTLMTRDDRLRDAARSVHALWEPET